ncbi:MAG: protein kinase domain-containing protein, partial [Phycisphaerales bacterium]
MNPEKYQLASEIFLQACELEGPARIEFLDRACGADGELRRMLEGMLAVHDRSDDSVAEPGVRMHFDSWDSSRAESDDAPKTIGPFEVVRRIGEGGMGEVFEARQSSPARTVAIKLLRRGSSAIIHRFRREVESLARLSHPGVAQIYQAGVADLHGRQVPYFAMELVKGDPITAYASSGHRSLRDRLELVAALCDTIQFAHQQGVIHRDLKPANILVAEHGGKPIVKVLDFGIARLVAGEGDESTLVTEAGQLIGTPGFMAPEQVRNEPGGVDTRCDVYALGVLTYLLVAGRMPVDVASRSSIQAAMAVLEQDPVPLRTIVRDVAADLELVIAKAMERDRARRYSSAGEFGADLRRVLAKEPVLARPPTAGYLLRRFASRHKALVGGVAAAVVTLVVALVVVGVMLRREQGLRLVAEAAQTKATREAFLQREMANFLLLDMLGQAGPSRRGTNLTVVEMVDAAVDELDTRFKSDVTLRGRARNSLANLQYSVGKFSAAEESCRKAITELNSATETDVDMIIEALRLHANVLKDLGRRPEAESQAQRALELSEAHPLVKPEIRVRIRATLGELLQARGEHAQAEQLLREAITRWPPDTPEAWRGVLVARNSLASSLFAQKRPSEGLEQLVLGLDEINEHVPDARLLKGVFLLRSAATMSTLGRHSEALPMALEGLENARGVFPSRHPQLAMAEGLAASVLRENGRVSEAAQMQSKTLATLRAVYDDGNWSVESAAMTAAEFHGSAGNLEEQISAFAVALRARWIAAKADEGEGVKKRLVEYA